MPFFTLQKKERDQIKRLVLGGIYHREEGERFRI
jgi:hypothetical protein